MIRLLKDIQRKLVLLYSSLKHASAVYVIFLISWSERLWPKQKIRQKQKDEKKTIHTNPRRNLECWDSPGFEESINKIVFQFNKNQLNVITKRSQVPIALILEFTRVPHYTLSVLIKCNRATRSAVNHAPRSWTSKIHKSQYPSLMLFRIIKTKKTATINNLEECRSFKILRTILFATLRINTLVTCTLNNKIILSKTIQSRNPSFSNQHYALTYLTGPPYLQSLIKTRQPFSRPTTPTPPKSSNPTRSQSLRTLVPTASRRQPWDPISHLLARTRVSRRAGQQRHPDLSNTRTTTTRALLGGSSCISGITGRALLGATSARALTILDDLGLAAAPRAASCTRGVRVMCKSERERERGEEIEARVRTGCAQDSSFFLCVPFGLISGLVFGSVMVFFFAWRGRCILSRRRLEVSGEKSGWGSMRHDGVGWGGGGSLSARISRGVLVRE